MFGTQPEEEGPTALREEKERLQGTLPQMEIEVHVDELDEHARFLIGDTEHQITKRSTHE